MSLDCVWLLNRRGGLLKCAASLYLVSVLNYVFDLSDSKIVVIDKTMQFLQDAFPDFNTESILDYFFEDSDSTNELIQEYEDKAHR